MGHGSGAHLSLLTIVQEAVVRSRDAYWLSTFSKSKSLPEDEYSSDEDSPTCRRIHPPSHREGEIEISAGIRRLEIWGGEAVEIPRIKGMILMAGVSDVIKHIRSEFKNGIEQISPLRRALGPSHAACLMASPSHLIYGAKQVSALSSCQLSFLIDIYVIAYRYQLLAGQFPAHPRRAGQGYTHRPNSTRKDSPSRSRSPQCRPQSIQGALAYGMHHGAMRPQNKQVQRYDPR